MPSHDFQDGPGIDRLSGLDGDVFVIAKRTSSLRDVRGALLELAYVLHDEDVRSRGSREPPLLPATGLLVLSDSKVHERTLQRELQQFQSIIDAALRGRLHAVLAPGGAGLEADRMPAGLPPALAPLVAGLVARDRGQVVRGGRVTKSMVKAAMLAAYAAVAPQEQPASVADLQRVTRASYPTVAGALKELAGRRALDDSGVRLNPPDPDLWRSIATGLVADRRTRRYVDPTGQAMRPERMLVLLERLLGQRIPGREAAGPGGLPMAVSGVLGAKRLYPGLDITSAMRLDLCVFDADDGFVRQLDPGLVRTEDPLAKAALVLHFTRDVRPPPLRRNSEEANFVESGADEPVFRIEPASAVDCFADLLEMGYAREAREFALAMTSRGGG
ncbi:hypothetical protein [Roseateles sp.]|uniref:hypothetical protein n=1 Tax=Roseateles sp. TaxID=1971397 RepID=UPI0031D948E4